MPMHIYSLDSVMYWNISYVFNGVVFPKSINDLWNIKGKIQLPWAEVRKCCC